MSTITAAPHSKLHEKRSLRSTRVTEAKGILIEILNDKEHPRYFCTDSEFKDLVGLSEPIIRKVRKDLNVLQRDERIYQYLLPSKPGTMFMDEMLLALGGRVEYHCLYHIMQKRGISYPRRNK